MFTQSDITFAMLLAFGAGAALATVIFYKPKKPRNYDPPYHKGNGDPQPFGEWHPDYAIGNEPVKVYPSYDVWARAKGLV